VDIDENSLTMNRLRLAGYLQDAKAGDLRNICTVSSIEQSRQLWITAAHCVADIGEEGRYVEGSPVELIDVRPEIDIAIIRVRGLRVPALTMQKTPVAWMQEILIVGHPFGYDPVFITRGYVANPRGLLDSDPYMLFNVAAAPGNSGSPVINLKGEIVSILQVGWGEGFSPVSGGAPYENLKQFEQYFALAEWPLLTVETPFQPVPEPWD
jgi:hypothetical protein